MSNQFNKIYYNSVKIKAQDIDSAVSIAAGLLIRLPDQYPVLPWLAIDPAVDLDGSCQYVQAPNGGTVATDDLSRSK